MAYITIPALPLGTALTGLEQFEAVQSSISVKLTGNQMKTFMSSSPSLTVDDSATNTVSTAATLLHITNATPAAGFGTGLAFAAELSSGNNFTGSIIQAIATNAGAGSETFDLAIRLMNLGVAAAEIARFTADSRLGVGTSTPAATLHGVLNDAVNGSVSRALQIAHTTSGVPGSGIGVGVAFEVETSAGNNEIGSAIDSVAVDATIGVENFDLVFSLMNAGASLAEVVRFKSTGRVGIGTAAPNASLEVATSDANNASPVTVARFSHVTSGVPAIGIGTAIDFMTETSSGTNRVGAAIYTEATNVSSGIEDFDLAFAVMKDGVAGVEVMRATSDLRVGINTDLPQTTLHALVADTATTTVTQAARLTHITSNSPAAGFGVGLEFESETTPNNYEIGGVIESVIVSPTSTAEGFNLVMRTMSAGATATEKLRVGDVVYTPQSFGAGTIPTADAWIHAGTGTATVALMDLDPGVLLTTPFQGAMEYEGKSLYFTPNGTERSVLQAMQVFQLNADRTANGAITTIQSLFGKAVAVQAGTRYQYEINATITNTAATAKSLQYALAGGATITAHDYEVLNTFAATAVTPTASSLMQNRITTGFGTLVSVTAATGAAAGAFTVRIRGSFDVSAAGTIDFSFGLTAVGTAVAIVAGSSVALWAVGATGADTQIGNWT